MLEHLLPGGERTIDGPGSTYDEDHTSALIHPQSTLTVKALAICLSDIQAKHGLTVQCLRAFCALLRKCFATIKLPLLSPTGANPLRHYVHNDTMVGCTFAGKGVSLTFGSLLIGTLHCDHNLLFTMLFHSGLFGCCLLVSNERWRCNTPRYSSRSELTPSRRMYYYPVIPGLLRIFLSAKEGNSYVKGSRAINLTRLMASCATVWMERLHASRCRESVTNTATKILK